MVPVTAPPATPFREQWQLRPARRPGIIIGLRGPGLVVGLRRPRLSVGARRPGLARRHGLTVRTSRGAIGARGAGPTSGLASGLPRLRVAGGTPPGGLRPGPARRGGGPQRAAPF